MFYYILDTFKYSYQIFLPLDKCDGKEMPFAEVVACDFLVWHELIKQQMTCPLLSICQYKETPSV